MPYLAPTWRFGDPISASKLNRTTSLVNQLIRQRPLGAVPSEIGAGDLLQVEVKAINDGLRTLTCTIPGAIAAPGAEEYTVALPQIFNETSRGSISYTYSSLNNRTATGPGGTELQEITPSFIVGDVVFVLFDFESSSIIFLGDGRMWAKTG